LSDELARRELLQADLLGALGEALRDHIRFEENDLFPAVESSAPEEGLWRMSEQLDTERSRTGQGGCALPPGPRATGEGR
jgi:hypothetical protein